MQLLPLVIYPDADTLVNFFRNELDSPLIQPIEMNETLMFSLRDTELFTLKPDSPVPKLREELESVLGIPIPKSVFDYCKYCSIIYASFIEIFVNIVLLDLPYLCCYNQE